MSGGTVSASVSKATEVAKSWANYGSSWFNSAT